jgi:hypothetical protein
VNDLNNFKKKLNAKFLTKITLLVFISFSIFYFIYKEMGASNNGDGKKSEAKAQSSDKDGIYAYYFHGTKRCYSCHVMQGYIEDVIGKEFKDEVENGELSWAVLNVQTPQNNHFIQDFQLTSISMILAKKVDGKIKEWKNLDKVWQLLKDKNGFYSYIKSEIDSFLDKK